MIRPLRRRHLQAILLLAVLVPMLLVAALRARRGFPTAPLPEALAAPATP